MGHRGSIQPACLDAEVDPVGGASKHPPRNDHPARLDAGLHSVALGADLANPRDRDLFDGSTRWLGVSVDTHDELPDRIAVLSVPSAIRAGSASEADRLSVPLSFADLADPPEDQDSLAAVACAEGEVPSCQGGKSDGAARSARYHVASNSNGSYGFVGNQRVNTTWALWIK